MTLSDALIGNIITGVVGVLGLIGALVAVVLGNFHSRKQQRTQLEFDALERQKERGVQLRREVYLPGAAAITAMFNCLGRMVDPSASQSDLDQTAGEFAAAMAKIQLVASRATIPHIAALQRVMMQTYVELTRARYPLVLRLTDINLAWTWMQKYQAEAEEISQAMKAQNLSLNLDRSTWEQLSRRFEFARTQSESFFEKWEHLTTIQQKDHHALAKLLIERLNALMRLQVAAFNAVRRELEQDDASLEMTAEFEKTEAVMRNELALLIETIERSVFSESTSSAAESQGD